MKKILSIEELGVFLQQAVCLEIGVWRVNEGLDLEG